MRIIDIGVPLEAAPVAPWTYRFKRVEHDEGARAMLKLFKGSAVGDYPESMGLGWETITLTGHAGNHIDAPWHFGPLCEGRPARTIDQIPLEWCYGPGVRLDFRHRQGEDITIEDIERELEHIDYRLKPLDIVLLWTGADEFIEDVHEYTRRQAGLSVEGQHYLLDHGVKLIGIDGIAMDVSFATMQRAFREGQPDPFFPAHFVGRAREHLHMEKLANLGAIPYPHGFIVSALPIKITGASAGWVRPVAIVED
ncbi:MAG TPA: cyclase family protein [Candidatus Binataceae bacterium]|nr:cyclase family protein [Candidatus Binataceae bacterium]